LIGGIVGDDLPLDRRAEHRLEAPEHLVDGRGHVAVGARRLEPLHGLGVDLVEPELAQDREQVRVEVLR
jgi:hypothetical protein